MKWSTDKKDFGRNTTCKNSLVQNYMVQSVDTPNKQLCIRNYLTFGFFHWRIVVDMGSWWVSKSASKTLIMAQKTFNGYTNMITSHLHNIYVVVKLKAEGKVKYMGLMGFNLAWVVIVVLEPYFVSHHGYSCIFNHFTFLLVSILFPSKFNWIKWKLLWTI